MIGLHILCLNCILYSVVHLLFKKDIYTLHVFNTLSSTVPFNKTMAINRTWESVESMGV